VAVAALWATQVGLERQPQVDRGDDRSAIEGLTPEDRPLSREKPVLRWLPPEGSEGAHYKVVVSDSQGVPIHQADRLSDTKYRLPAELIDPLAPGTTLWWRVEGTLPDGSPLSSTSSRVTFE
jgi:hypothetical protein